MNKSKTEKAPSFCACMAMRMASRTITKIYDQALKPSGIKVTQFSILMNIKTHGPVNISTLAKLQHLDRTTLVRNLKPLEIAKLLESVPSNNPRERQVHITDHGLKTIKIALPYWKTIQRKISNKLNLEQLNLLESFANSLEDVVASEDEAISR